MTNEEKARGWLIYSREHNAWWRANSRGYTVHMKSAGLYSREEAEKICFTDPLRTWPGHPDDGPCEFMVPAPAALTEARRAALEEAARVAEAAQPKDGSGAVSGCCDAPLRIAAAILRAREADHAR